MVHVVGWPEPVDKTPQGRDEALVIQRQWHQWRDSMAAARWRWR
jgi:hypothetical protein